MQTANIHGAAANDRQRYQRRQIARPILRAKNPPNPAEILISAARWRLHVASRPLLDIKHVTSCIIRHDLWAFARWHLCRRAVAESIAADSSKRDEATSSLSAPITGATAAIAELPQIESTFATAARGTFALCNRGLFVNFRYAPIATEVSWRVQYGSTAEVRRFTQSLRQREPAATVAPSTESVWPSDARLCCQFQDTINAGAF